jgi:REP element-mobilizing transposase RayT
MKQLGLPLPQRGGKRRHAGRKPSGDRALVSHAARDRFSATTAVLVTLRVATHVWNLRSRRCFEAIEDCLPDTRNRFGLRVIEFSVLGNHIHLLVEADSNEALSRAMKGLCVRLAKALNSVMRCTGRVFADHHHSRVLGSPAEVATAMAYVFTNAEHHYGDEGRDRYCSNSYDAAHRAHVLSAPCSWLLRVGWRKARRIPECLGPTRTHAPGVAERMMPYGMRLGRHGRRARFEFDSGDILRSRFAAAAMSAGCAGGAW